MDADGGVPDPAGRLDVVQMMALENPSMDVEKAFLPSMFTGKNRLIIDQPQQDADQASLEGHGRGSG